MQKLSLLVLSALALSACNATSITLENAAMKVNRIAVPAGMKASSPSNPASETVFYGQWDKEPSALLVALDHPPLYIVRCGLLGA